MTSKQAMIGGAVKLLSTIGRALPSLSKAKSIPSVMAGVPKTEKFIGKPVRNSWKAMKMDGMPKTRRTVSLSKYPSAAAAGYGLYGAATQANQDIRGASDAATSYLGVDPESQKEIAKRLAISAAKETGRVAALRGTRTEGALLRGAAMSQPKANNNHLSSILGLIKTPASLATSTAISSGAGLLRSMDTDVGSSVLKDLSEGRLPVTGEAAKDLAGIGMFTAGKIDPKVMLNNLARDYMTSRLESGRSAAETAASGLGRLIKESPEARRNRLYNEMLEARSRSRTAGGMNSSIRDRLPAPASFDDAAMKEWIMEQKMRADKAKANRPVYLPNRIG